MSELEVWREGGFWAAKISHPSELSYQSRVPFSQLPRTPYLDHERGVDSSWITSALPTIRELLCGGSNRNAECAHFYSVASYGYLSDLELSCPRLGGRSLLLCVAKGVAHRTGKQVPAYQQAQCNPDESKCDRPRCRRGHQKWYFLDHQH